MNLNDGLKMSLRARVGVGCLLGMTFAVGLCGWRMGVDLASLKLLWQQLNGYLVDHPWALFVSLVILPGLPVPMSALLITAGVVWREQPVMACLLCLLATTLNLAWTYWLAAGPARQLVEKMLAATSIKVPELPRDNHLKLILLMKLTPGIPFFFQNYLLGFLRAPFMLFLPISILCNGIIGTGIVLSGAGLANGNLKNAFWGASLIGLGVVITQLIRSWLARAKAKIRSREEGSSCSRVVNSTEAP